MSKEKKIEIINLTKDNILKSADSINSATSEFSHFELHGNIDDVRALVQVFISQNNLPCIIQLIEMNANLLNEEVKEFLCRDIQAALTTAFTYSSTIIMGFAIDNGANINHTTPDGTSLLHRAIFNNNQEVASFLLSRQEVNVNSSNESGSCLHAAAAHNNINLVNRLIERGIDLTIKNARGEDAFDLVRGAYPEIANIIAKAYVEQLGTKEKAEEKLQIPSSITVNEENFEEMLEVIEKTISGTSEIIITSDQANLDRLLSVFLTKQNISCSALLINHGALPDVLNENNLNFIINNIATFLLGSFRHNLFHTMELLFTLGGNIEMILNNKYTMAHAAAAKGNLGMLKFLLDHNISVDLSDTTGNSLLHYAIMSERLEIFQFLISRGANINLPDPAGKTVLILAIEAGLTEIAALLIENDQLEINKQFSFGSALNYAALFKNIRIAELLIERGINLTIKSNTNKTAYEVAEKTDETIANLIQKTVEEKLKKEQEEARIKAERAEAELLKEIEDEKIRENNKKAAKKKAKEEKKANSKEQEKIVQLLEITAKEAEEKVKKFEKPVKKQEIIPQKAEQVNISEEEVGIPKKKEKNEAQKLKRAAVLKAREEEKLKMQAQEEDIGKQKEPSEQPESLKASKTESEEVSNITADNYNNIETPNTGITPLQNIQHQAERYPLNSHVPNFNFAPIKIIVFDNILLTPEIINHQDQNFNTALHYAAEKNDHDAIKLLIKCGARHDIKNAQGITAFDLALNHGSHNIMLSASSNQQPSSSNGASAQTGKQRSSGEEKFQINKDKEEKKGHKTSNPRDESEKKKDSIISILIDMMNDEIEHLPKWIKAIIHKSSFYLQAKENQKYLDNLFSFKTIAERFSEIFKKDETTDNNDETVDYADRACVSQDLSSHDHIEKYMPGTIPFLASQ